MRSHLMGDHVNNPGRRPGIFIELASALLKRLAELAEEKSADVDMPITADIMGSCLLSKAIEERDQTKHTSTILKSLHGDDTAPALGPMSRMGKAERRAHAVEPDGMKARQL